jgi:predicted  nucleic acid-binding Zn-ribbon protein
LDLDLIKRLRQRFQKAEHRIAVLEHELMLLEGRVRELEEHQAGESDAPDDGVDPS